MLTFVTANESVQPVIDLRFTLIGIIIGFLIGLTGAGGGSLMTPVMILIMGVKPLVAVGTDLAYGAITRAVGGATHLRQGTVHRETALLLATGSVPATILGVAFMSLVKREYPALVDVFLLRSIAWALIVVGAVLFLKPWILRSLDHRQRIQGADWRDRVLDRGRRDRWLLPLVGLAVGFLVGMTSVGAGSLVIIALLVLYPRWQSREMVGTDVFHAAVLTSAASIAQLFAGNVDLSMMISLLLGSIPGVVLGSRLALGFPDQLLRLSMASVLLVSGAKLL